MVTSWGAAWSITPQRPGKKTTSAMRPGSSPVAATDIVTASGRRAERGGPGAGAGDRAAGLLDGGGPDAGRGLAGDDREGERHVGLFRNADLLADQPRGMAAQGDRRAGGQARGRGQAGEEQNLAGIAVAHQRADRHALGLGEDERPRLPARGQVPVQRRRLAGIARVRPVRVPAGDDALAEAHPEGRARLDGGDVAHQADRDSGRAGRRRRLDGGRACGLGGEARASHHPDQKRGGEKPGRHRGRT